MAIAFPSLYLECLLLILFMLLVMSLFFALQFRLSFLIFFPAASARLFRLRLLALAAAAAEAEAPLVHTREGYGTGRNKKIIEIPRGGVEGGKERKQTKFL